MANAYVKLSEFEESTLNHMNDSDLIETSVFSGANTYNSYKTTFATFANYILNKFESLPLAGAAQTVKAAIDGVNTALTNLTTSVGTIADRVTATETDITTLQNQVDEGEAGVASDIADLQAEDTRLGGLITGLDSRVTQNESDITSLGTRMSTAESSISTTSTTLSTAVGNIATLTVSKAPVIINTVVGTPAAFTDAIDGMPIQLLNLRVRAVQSGEGDPSPDNIRTFTGWNNVALIVSTSDIDYMDGTTTYYNLGRTVYGGTFNVITGVLEVTHGFIESYDGEELPGEWFSDRDVQEDGNSPTTGAQVVYELATPESYQLTGTAMSTVSGRNSYYANCGDVEITYYADTKLYIDSAIERVIAMIPDVTSSETEEG